MEEESLLNDEYFMQKALQQAELAYDEGEIPIGAVVVYENKIIGKGYNQTEKLVDVTAHAEMLAITSAEQYLSSKYLNECTLYVTIEPCVMCAGAIQWARFSKVVFGAEEPKSGYTKKSMNLISSKTEVVKGVMEVECAELIKNFFLSKRK